MKRKQRFSKQFIIGIFLYGVAISLQLTILKAMSLPTYFKIPIALLPMAPALWAMSGWLNSVRQLDEFQRKVSLETVAFSLGATAIITFSYGFLETFIDFPRLSMFYIWVLIAAGFMIGQLLAIRRYS